MSNSFTKFIFAILLGVASVSAQQAKGPQFQSAFMRVELAPDQPAFAAIALDSLGKEKLSVNSLQPPTPTGARYELRQAGSSYEYRFAGASTHTPPVWTFEFSERHIHLRSDYSPKGAPLPLELSVNQYFNHATLLGIMNDDSSVQIPALLHLPDIGTLRITSPTRGVPALGYAAHRIDKIDILSRRAPYIPKTGYVRVTFSPATAAMREVDYDLEVVAIYPEVAGIESDPRFDSFRRDWLNIFQLTPRERMLSNHAASGPCPCTVYEFSSVAERTPPLAPGLTALDLVRLTLDRYLDGYRTVGMEGFGNAASPGFMDSYPSLLIAASDYVRASKDHAWLEKNYPGLKDWAAKMLARDADGDGLLEYQESGNSNSWPDKRQRAPANWWDTIGFGHKDAYVNALAYRALVGMSETARQANQPDDAKMYSARAEKLHSVYFQTFYSPQTGILAGWKSADGNLHDYYFTFVNSIAIVFGLVPRDQANLIMDRLLAKMREVGYTKFEYGLPGNLIPVRRGDYAVRDHRSGGSVQEDGSDGFQVYENGGATADFVYYTLQALYDLGRRNDGDMILFPLLEGYEKGGFQGFGPNNMSYDWKTWDGIPWGYEGLLVDNYQAFLAVLAR